MFLAIINDSYTEVKGDDTLQNDFEVGEYFKKVSVAQIYTYKSLLSDIRTNLILVRYFGNLLPLLG